MHGIEQLEIFHHPLLQGLAENVILHCDGDVAGDCSQRLQFFTVKGNACRPGTERDRTGQLRTRSQRNNAAKQFGRHVAAGAEVLVPGFGRNRLGSGRVQQGIHLATKQRDISTLREKRQATPGDGIQLRRLFREGEQHAFAHADDFHHEPQHGLGRFLKISFTGQHRPQIGQRA